MYKSLKLDVMSNEKRALTSCLKQSDFESKEFGQLYCIKLSSGSVVGNHFHKAKEEWLVPIAGKMRIFLEDTRDKRKCEVILDADKPESIKISPFIAHAVENLSDSQAVLLEYASKPFDPQQEDKLFYQTSPA